MMLIKILKRSLVEFGVTIPGGLEAAVTILLSNSTMNTVHKSENIVLREKDEESSLHRSKVLCSIACSDPIGLGQGKNILISILENGKSLGEKKVHVPPGAKALMKIYTFMLKEK